MAVAIADLGEMEPAIARMKQVVDVWLRISGPESSSTWYAQQHLANMLADSGRVQDAIDLAFVLLDIQSQTVGDNDEWTLVTRHSLAAYMSLSGRL